MGRSWWVGGCLLLALVACAPKAATLVPRDGVLVLELGGDHPSLREELERRSVPPRPPRSWRSVALPDDPVPAVVPAPPGDVGQEPGADPAPSGGGQAGGGGRSEAAPADAAGQDWFEVRLGKQETLMHLAKKHLGRSTRFPEILQLNGWTDADARKLREGQIVKIPRPRAR